MNPKYRIKNIKTEPVPLFLKTRNHSNARTNERSILTPRAISVMNTLLSGFLTDPRKKTTRAVNEISANEDIRGTAFSGGTSPGDILSAMRNSRRKDTAKMRRYR
ncbi:MAG: hypothetical protein MUC70_01120 [Bacteroidales bacterium]|nr:hypothetical protein [Bacteroidales bacterium]